MDQKVDKQDVVHTTLYLPKWLHTAIKLEAARERRRMTDIIVEQLTPRYEVQQPEQQAETVTA
jgi:hypothetical protein